MQAPSRYLFTILLTSLTSWLGAATCVSTGNGNWTSGSTWSCGSAPSCGDSIVIDAGHTVSITAQDYKSCGSNMVLVIKGTLKFTAFGKLEFSCTGRVYILAGAQIVAATGAGGNDNAVMQCNSTWWNAGAGTYNGPGCMPPFAANCSAVLPVELVSFAASKCDETAICVEWTTATEINHQYYEVMRSENGIQFHTIERVNSTSGESRVIKNYTVRDEDPFEGINYYKLKQVDRNGSTKVFPLIVTDFAYSNGLHFSIVPNPHNGTFAIRSAGMHRGQQALIQIMNVTGRTVFSEVQTRSAESKDLLITAALKAGVYYCVVSVSGKKEIYKMIVAP